MYSLLQSGLLANKILGKLINKRSYQQRKLVPRLWKHEWQPIQFTLVVDNLCVKYVGEKHALHLKETLKEKLQSHNRVGWRKVHWNLIRLVL